MVPEDDYPKQESDQRVSQMNKRLELDHEEVDVLREFERGELESIRNFKDEKRRLEAAAREFLKKGPAHQHQNFIPRSGMLGKRER